MTFEKLIVGSRGTITWINGYGWTKVEVIESGPGYVTVQKWDKDDLLVVPTSSILHYKFAGEDD